MACRSTNIVLESTSIYAAGKKHRTNQVTIGGDLNKAHIFVRNLKPVEFIVEEQKGKVHIFNAETEKMVDTFSSLSARMVNTSNPDIVLWIGLNEKMIQEVQCGE